MSSFSRNMNRTLNEDELSDVSRNTICFKVVWNKLVMLFALVKLILTDFCNVLWGLKQVYGWNHNIKCTLYGVITCGMSHYYIIKPIEDKWVLSIPLSFVLLGCLTKSGMYLNQYMIANPNTALGSTAGKDYPLGQNESFKMRKALYYLGFSGLNPGDDIRMEFTRGLKEGINNWWENRNCEYDTMGTKSVMCNTVLCSNHKGSGTLNDPIDLTEEDNENNSESIESDGSDNGDSSGDDSGLGVEVYLDEECSNPIELCEFGDIITKVIDTLDPNNSVVELIDLGDVPPRPINPTPESEQNKKDK